MRQILEPMLGGLLSLMLAVPASSADRKLSECQAAIVLHGIASRGSLVCNPAWLDRAGSYAILRMAQSCKGTVGTKALIARGFSDFEQKMKELGKEAACQQINDLIKKME